MLSYLIRRRFPNWQLIFAQTNILYLGNFFLLETILDGFSTVIGNLDKYAVATFNDKFCMKFQYLPTVIVGQI